MMVLSMVECSGALGLGYQSYTEALKGRYSFSENMVWASCLKNDFRNDWHAVFYFMLLSFARLLLGHFGIYAMIADY